MLFEKNIFHKTKTIGLLFLLCLFSFSGFSQSKVTTYATPQSSVLASGDWYKIGVDKTGVYKITYSDLERMGVSMSGLKSAQISVFGNGGGMLPENNTIPRYNDLVENAIQIVNDVNGNFTSGSYILFYAQSPNLWIFDAEKSLFTYDIHLYSKENYYFVCIGESSDARKRIVKKATVPEAPNKEITQFNDYYLNKEENLNIPMSGRIWFSKEFRSGMQPPTIQVPLTDIVIGSQISIYTSVASNSTEATDFVEKFNDKGIDTLLISSITSNPYAYSPKSNRKTITAEKAANAITLTFNYQNTQAKGWLERIELNYLRSLRLSGEQMNFRSIESTGEGNVSKFTIDNANSRTQVWDVSNPLNPVLMDATLQGSQLTFVSETDSLKEFVTFNGSSLVPSLPSGKLDNQNLHALPQTDYVIVTSAQFTEQAENLAKLHREHNGLDVTVVNVDQVYNEFSSGVQDPMAIRAFMKMFYDRSQNGEGKAPKYLLLFGDGTFDPKQIISNNNKQYIVAYQSTGQPGYASDDVFGFLENNAVGNPSSTLNIGIGRFPVSSASSAKTMVDRSKQYLLKSDIVEDKDNGDWRNIIALIADDPDGNYASFSGNSENLAASLSGFPYINIEKIYADAYKEVSSPSGTTYPDVTKAINNRMNKGCLMVDYVGHGAYNYLGHESYTTQTDITGWTNKYKMPVFITNTCEFAHFDFVAETSAGENCIMNPNGGAIALISTTRKVVENANLNAAWFMNALTLNPETGKMPGFGDVIRTTKNANRSNPEYILLGDPALSLPVPFENVNTLKVNSKDAMEEVDTARSLSKVFIEGEIADKNNQKLSNFDGTVFITVYDKPITIKTQGNTSAASIVSFEQQKSIIYKGFAKVLGGDFSYSFTVPKDISYKYGYGKISYFAQNDSVQATGYYNNLVIGDIDESQIPDTTAPVVKLYMNDESFYNGGITDANPLLYAVLQDKYGINMVGSGIGHDIEAILDGKVNNVVILNDYYVNDLDDPTKGYILYPFTNLSEGTHTLQLRVWNIYNVSTTVSISFVVKSSGSLELGDFHVYPNPFSVSTTLALEENQPENIEKATLQIFTSQGQLIFEKEMPVYNDSYTIGPMVWDGTSRGGARLSGGIFIARILVETKSGEQKVASKKIIMLK